MFPPQKMIADALALRVDRASLRRRGEAHRAGAFDEIVRRREDRAQRIGDLGVGDGDEIGEPVQQRREGERRRSSASPRPRRRCRRAASVRRGCARASES